MDLLRLYYLLKPFIPRSLQIELRRARIRKQREANQHIWPIDPASATPPSGWNGWPDGKKFAVVLTHDVETQLGHAKSINLMRLEKERGFCSSFNFVPERYMVDPMVRHELEVNGFEVGVHGLNHDGNLYASREEFLQRAQKINRYLQEWNVTGFRSPAMHHNLDWLRDLNILYDASTFDTDPFEPQPDPARTIFPFIVEDEGSRKGYVEFPYTLAQDFTLFVIMQERDDRIWRKKLDWIVENGGMALLNVHPDYMYFGTGKTPFDQFPANLYSRFLDYIRIHYKDQYWHGLPRELAAFWRSRTDSPAVVNG